MFQGSAESTLLFITGSEKLVDWAERNNKWSSGKLESYKQKVMYSKQKYKENFVHEGKYFANNPLRENTTGRPRFKYSFCDGHERNKSELVLAWCEKNNQGYYLCPDCKNEKIEDFQDKDKRYVLNSVSLIPVYIKSDIFSDEEIESFVKPIVEQFKEKNIIPSNIEGTRSLGYDYGLMLYNMIKLNNPVKDEILSKTLSLLDATGAWVEYYDGDKPFNCRARPWESAINIEAVIEYIQYLNQ